MTPSVDAQEHPRISLKRYKDLFLSRGAVNRRNGMPERRSSKRVRVHLEGRVVCDTSSLSVECIIRDISSTGARLVFPCLGEIPLEFVLQIPGTDAASKGRLVWSTGQENGIVFTD
jgi:hypothetical protein